MESENSGDPMRFRRELTRLKQDGASFLVVGDAVVAHRGFCHQVLDRASVTRRVFVDTDGTSCYRPGQPADRPGRSTDAHIRYRAETRSASAVPTPTGDEAMGTHVSTLRELGERLSAAITGAAGDVDEPATLRLCVDSLLPLVDATDDEQVFRLLHTVLAESREANAMAHVHLPVERSDWLASLFPPLFDAVVELRMRDGLADQRWHVDHADITTSWLPITRP